MPYDMLLMVHERLITDMFSAYWWVDVGKVFFVVVHVREWSAYDADIYGG